MDVKFELRRMAMLTSGVAELTRARAEAAVKDLVKAGEVKRKQARSLAGELIEISKQNRKELLRLVRSEIKDQIAALGVATERDVQRLERRIKRLEDRPSSGSRKTTAKKTARKSTRKRSTAKKSTAKKSTGRGSGS